MKKNSDQHPMLKIIMMLAVWAYRQLRFRTLPVKTVSTMVEYSSSSQADKRRAILSGALALETKQS